MVKKPNPKEDLKQPIDGLVELRDFLDKLINKSANESVYIDKVWGMIDRGVKEKPGPSGINLEKVPSGFHKITFTIEYYGKGKSNINQ